MRTIGIAFVIGGLTLAVADYLVINSSSPPSSLGQVLADIDDLNGALAGYSPWLGIGSLFAIAGAIMAVSA